ncbi:RHS repeat-associated core domain-containing protein [Kordiimonas marina]|uniref:RHS repeat-associated core domain-containing protein n=1 Tax=Kordiimonas marina TaxID=2872312 RepID=UPI001FF1834D|nr:RHS repeat-associated core domain-containing protein [Kordiimonas marina]MCJ9430029.1 hypothetical protein [Kordiimonas marina]
MFVKKAIKSVVSAAIVAGGTLVAPGVSAAVPVVHMYDGIERTPGATFTSATGHTPTWTVGIHPEILALARSLKNDPALIYQYVRDNIETLPMFGLQKGALGALIDKKGTALDQAALMVELLKAAHANKPAVDYLPTYRFIKAQLSPAEMASWFGLSDRQDVCNLLKAGAIPFSITVTQGATGTTDCAAIGQGSYDNVQILHAVVEATVNSASAAFDPSYKVQTYHQARSSLATDMGYDYSTLQGDASFTVNTNTTTGITAVSGDVHSNVETDLAAYASTLVSTLKKDTAQGDSEDAYKLSMVDVVGGVEIAKDKDQATLPTTWLTLSQLPHYSAAYGTGSTDVPDQYRTKVTLTYNGQSFSAFMDELAGKKLWLSISGTSPSVYLKFMVNDRVAWSVLYDDTVIRLITKITHPYGDTSADYTQSFNLPVYVQRSFPLFISSGDFGTGAMGRYLDSNWQKLGEDTSLDTAGIPDTTEGLLAVGAQFLAQQSQLNHIVAGVSGSRILTHNTVGVITTEGNIGQASYADFRSQVSIVSLGNGTSTSAELSASRSATADTLTSASSALEGAVFDQFADDHGTDAATHTSVQMLAYTLRSGGTLYDVPANAISNIQSSLSNYSANVLTRLSDYNTDATQPYRLIVSDAGGIGTISLVGYVAIDDTTGNTGFLVDQDSSTPSYNYTKIVPLKGATTPYSIPSGMEYLYQMIQAAEGTNSETIPAAGAASVTRTFLKTGAGSFPYSLSYTPTYVVGSGWTDSLDISAYFSGNGMVALGSRTPVEAANAIAALHATYDYLKNCISASTAPCGKGEQVAFSAVTMSWLQKKLRDNVFNVSQGNSVTAYTKLADGKYFGPEGDVRSFSSSGSGSSAQVILTQQNGTKMTFDALDSSGRSFSLTTWHWPFGVTLTFSNVSGQRTVSNNLGRSLTFNSVTNEVTDENGRKVTRTETSTTHTFTLTGLGTHDLATYSIDSDGRIASISTPVDTDQTTFTYDALGRLVSQNVKDRGETDYYSNNWRSETVSPRGASQVVYSDPYGRYSRLVDAAGRETEQRFDRLGRLIYASVPADANGDYTYVEYSYDRYYNRLSKTVFAKPVNSSRTKKTTTYSYYGTGKYRQLASITVLDGTSDSKTTSFDYVTSGNGVGKLQSKTLPSVSYVQDDGTTTSGALVTQYSYTAEGLPSQITAPDGTITEYGYTVDANGNTGGVPTSVTVSKGTTSQTVTLDYWPDGDLLRVTDARSKATTITYNDFRQRLKVSGPESVEVDYNYYDDGRLKAVKSRQDDNTTFNNTKTYDGAGRITSVTTSIEHTTYDSSGNPLTVAETAVHTTSISYDDANGIITVTDPMNVESQRYFDLLGRLTKVISAVGSTDEITEKTGYNTDGTVAYVEDGRELQTLYSYDEWNRQVSTSYAGGRSEQVTAFDPYGRPKTLQTFGGDTITLGYNAVGWVTSRSITSGPSYAYTYDAAGRQRSEVRTETDNTTTSVTHTYDDLGRPKQETGAYGYTMDYSYDDANGSYDLTYFSGTSQSYMVRYQMDGLGRVTSVSENGTTAVASYSYDPLSRVTNITYGNGSKQDFTYDADNGWLDSLTLDANGDGDTADAGEATFSYIGHDALGRITFESVSNTDYLWKPSGPNLTNGTTTYSALADGTKAANADNQYEKLTVKDLAGTTVLDTKTPGYDTKGNLTSFGEYSYVYDQENRLTTVKKQVNATTQVTVGSYSYDATGRRVQKVVGNVTTRYFWAGATTYAELNENDVVQRVYVYGPGIDNPVMVKEADGTKNYVHRDGKGNVAAVSNAAGTVTPFPMSAWGEGADASKSPYKFTARRMDDESGLYYYRNRYYQPELGRFMSRDPIGYGDGLNMYAYVHNDPVNNVDPLGLATVKCEEPDQWGGWYEVICSPDGGGDSAPNGYGAQVTGHGDYGSASNNQHTGSGSGSNKKKKDDPCKKLADTKDISNDLKAAINTQIKRVEEIRALTNTGNGTNSKYQSSYQGLDMGGYVHRATTQELWKRRIFGVFGVGGDPMVAGYVLEAININAAGGYPTRAGTFGGCMNCVNEGADALVVGVTPGYSKDYNMRRLPYFQKIAEAIKAPVVVVTDDGTNCVVK